MQAHLINERRRCFRGGATGWMFGDSITLQDNHSAVRQTLAGGSHGRTASHPFRLTTPRTRTCPWGPGEAEWMGHLARSERGYAAHTISKSAGSIFRHD
jgi:hypothetical protein